MTSRDPSESRDPRDPRESPRERGPSSARPLSGPLDEPRRAEGPHGARGEPRARVARPTGEPASPPRPPEDPTLGGARRGGAGDAGVERIEDGSTAEDPEG